ncbi:IclR family transcriptional regulator [Pelagibacterium montanilacus]|uniref:IclR family transcriptional regulator n=1 Tax=Pelagibacterium montanilacus TaxID=2185280 RepID=UPI000F8EBC3E|nr:IclR family transcriptional regulator [Pelagibacterium montanilacus]
MTMQEASATYHSRALDRGLTILDHLAQSRNGGETLADLHTRTGYPKSTLLRLLAVLERRGFVRSVDDGLRYQIGHAVVDLAQSFRQGADVSDLAAPYLERLAAQTHQTANMGVLDGDNVLHLVVREPDRALRFRSVSGSRDSVHCTGLGKMLLAGLDPERARRIVSRITLEPRTGHTRTTVDSLMDDVMATRERRYAIDDQEGAAGVCCLAVPLLAPGQPANSWQASISLSGPVGEMEGASRQRLLDALIACASDMMANAELVGALVLSDRR